MANHYNYTNSSTTRRSSIDRSVGSPTTVDWRSFQNEYTVAYDVCVTNLPSGTTATTLQQIIEQNLDFNSISVGDILMHTLENICWICNVKDEIVATSLAEKLNLQMEGGRRLSARKEIQRPEFCRAYRTGECTQSPCLFDHVPCSSQYSSECPQQCPKGHPKGMKEKIDIPRDEFQNYRIQIVGLPSRLDRADLARYLKHTRENQIFIFEGVVLIVNLKSLKYAKQLVERLHEKTYRPGFTMKCQIELNTKKTLQQINMFSEDGLQLLQNRHIRSNGSNLTRSLVNISYVTDQTRETTEIQNGAPAKSESDSSDDISPRVLTESDLATNPGQIFTNAIGPIIKQTERDKINTPSAVSKESSGLPYDVPAKWKKDGKSEGKSGGEGEVTPICLSTNKNITAVIKVYTYDTRTKRMRAYREITALKILNGLPNVSRLYSSSSTTDRITNIPDNRADAIDNHSYTIYWAIMTRIKGVTLKEYVNQRHNSHKKFSFVDALNLTEKLLRITKTIHARGIVHRDLKPDNIMVSFDNYADDTDKTEVFVIDFGLAYIETHENIDIDWSKYDEDNDATGFDDSLGNRWYRIPQLNRQDVSQMTDREKNDLFYVIRRSPTIDASSICAIFFWMWTRTWPEKNRDRNTNLAPHQREAAAIRAKINDVVTHIPDLSNLEREILVKRLQIYLMTTFDKGFEFPDHQWTIEQLEYRLKLIRNMLNSYQSPSLPMETFDNISDALVKLRDTTISVVPSVHAIRSPLDKIANAFFLAKRKFIENHSRNYRWSDGDCQWLDDVHNMIERKHYDILTYYLMNENWSIIVYCTAKINESGQYVLLSIGSIIQGLYIGVPIAEYATSGSRLDELDISVDFETALKNLIHLVYEFKHNNKKTDY